VDRGHLEPDDRISPGCDHCSSGPGFGVTMHADVQAEPLRWCTPRKVFVNSMSDVSGG
jgi:hypothetical protein